MSQNTPRGSCRGRSECVAHNQDLHDLLQGIYQLLKQLIEELG